MRIKCNDGKVRGFTTCGYQYNGRMSESECEECGQEFGRHDTKILKPKWKAHVCKKPTEPQPHE